MCSFLEITQFINEKKEILHQDKLIPIVLMLKSLALMADELNPSKENSSYP